MTTCKTCGTAYQSPDCLCPHCGAPLQRSLNLCHTCGMETNGQRLCPRCKTDVHIWEKENFSIYQFINRSGYMGLLPIILVASLGIYFQRQGAFYYALSSMVSILLSLLIFRLLYQGRLYWREQFWASQVYQVRDPPIMQNIFNTFLLGLVLLIAWVILYREVWNQPRWLWQQLLMTALYGLYPLAFTVSLTLFGIQQYLTELDERVPQPIFVQTEKLLEVTLQTLEKTLGENDRPMAKPSPPETPGPRFEVVRVTRNLKDGGLEATLREYRPARFPEPETPPDSNWEEMLWVIRADRWGRIRSIDPGAPDAEPCPESSSAPAPPSLISY